MRKPRASEAAWAGLVAGVSIYELMCPLGETLSERLWDAQETTAGKVLTYTAIGITALHLMDKLPERVDPIRGIGKIAGRIFDEG